MIDGQVKGIRKVLDNNGFSNVGILSYTAKYASAFYGPFREAAGSADAFKGDRKNHQMDVGNAREAVREAQTDIEESADILMVKPAWTNLDIIARLRELFPYPITAYSVSAEYSLLKLGAKEGLFQEEEAVRELLTCIKRAGADLIITYYAL